MGEYKTRKKAVINTAFLASDTAQDLLHFGHF